MTLLQNHGPLQRVSNVTQQSADDDAKGQRVHLAHTSTNPAPVVAAAGSRGRVLGAPAVRIRAVCSAARSCATAARPCRTPGLYFHAHDMTVPPELRRDRRPARAARDFHRLHEQDRSQFHRHLLQTDRPDRATARARAPRFDLGCGPGTDLASYATAMGPTGTVVGLDHDQTATRDAQQATAHLPQIEVHHWRGTPARIPDRLLRCRPHRPGAAAPTRPRRSSEPARPTAPTGWRGRGRRTRLGHPGR